MVFLSSGPQGNGRGRKPSSVVGRSSIYAARCRVAPAISLRARRAAVLLLIGSCIGWGLHRGSVSGARVSSYLAFPSLPPEGRFLSVALSLKSPSPAVNRHPALRCSDFPHGLRHATAWPPYRKGRIAPFDAAVNAVARGKALPKSVCIAMFDAV